MNTKKPIVIVLALFVVASLASFSRAAEPNDSIGDYALHYRLHASW